MAGGGAHVTQSEGVEGKEGKEGREDNTRLEVNCEGEWGGTFVRALDLLVSNDYTATFR